MSTIEFDDGGNSKITPMRRAVNTNYSPITKIIVGTGLATDKEGATKVMLIISGVFIVLSIIVIFAFRRQPAPPKDTPQEFMYRPEIINR